MKQYSFLEEFNLLNKSGSIMLFHISPIKLTDTVLVPRIPSSIDTSHNENSDRKRICFGRSINGCLSAVSYGGNTLENMTRVWYVYSPTDIDTRFLYQPSLKEVPDVDVTREIWYTKKCHLKYKGMIFVTEALKLKKEFRDDSNNIWYETHKRYEVIKTNYDPPLHIKQIKEKYGLLKTKNICGKKWYILKENDKDDTPGQIAHKWRAITGIELIHKEPSLKELDRIWKNWNLMTDKMKKVSDKKSIELYGVDNKKHYKELFNEY